MGGLVARGELWGVTVFRNLFLAGMGLVLAAGVPFIYYNAGDWLKIAAASAVALCRPLLRPAATRRPQPEPQPDQEPLRPARHRPPSGPPSLT